MTPLIFMRGRRGLATMQPAVGGGGGDASEPIWNGTGTSYYFEPFTSYANGTAMGSGGGGTYLYILTEDPTLSATAPVGTGGKKATYLRNSPDGGGIFEWAPTFSGFSLPASTDYLVTSWLYRNVGGSYEGKGLITSQLSGNYRYVCQPHGSRFVGGFDSVALMDCYWDTTTGDPKFADTPDLGEFCWMIWHDGIPDTIPWFSGPGGFAQYQHNIGKGFSENIYLDSASLIRHTLKLTCPPAGQVYTSGKGRIEMWIGGTKVIEWIGDDAGRPEFGKVLVPAQADLPYQALKWGGPAAHTWAGSATIEVADLRIWHA